MVQAIAALETGGHYADVLYTIAVLIGRRTMLAIGIRVAPTAVTFVVYDSELNEIINIEDMRIPIAFSTPEALKYVRNNLLDILREFEIKYAGIRVTEPSAQMPSIPRIQIEGVIQEAFASSALNGYYVGQISSISARIGIDRSDFKSYVDGTNQWHVDGWEDLKKEQREALLCAVGACHVQTV